MSEGNVIMGTMTEGFRNRCKEMADYLLEVFEAYWIKETADERDVQFVLYSNNLAFQIAWMVDYEYTDRLSEEAIQMVNDTYAKWDLGLF